MKKEKKIPTIIGLILLVIILYFGISLVTRKTTTSSQAGGSCDPVSVQITNITNKSVNISFLTTADCLSTISVSGQIVEDERSKGKIHYFEINSLEESKVYPFSIISNGQNYALDDYNFKTAQKPSSQIPDSNLAWGRVYNSDQTPATSAIVYFTIAGASPLSALVTSSGDWNIALATSFNESLTDYFSSPSNAEENIIIIDNNQNQTQIIGNTDHNNPVPDIIIGQNNFSAPSPIVTLPDVQSNLLNQDYNLSTGDTLSIINPENNENLSTQNPDFFGTAKAGSKLKIEVHSSEIIDGSVTADEDGNWNWSSSKSLTPGEHSVTVTDENNNSITKNFIVMAAESSTSFTASSSATPTQKPTLTPSPTPTSIPTSIPSTSSGIPRTGNAAPTEIIIILSLLSVSFAFIYYKKS